VTLDRASAAAVEAGVVIERLDRYALVSGRGEAVGFGYGLHEPEAISDSIRRIARGVATATFRHHRLAGA
jgi:DNA-binding transcriptional MocR family regulator